MKSKGNQVITVRAVVKKPVQKVWDCWSEPGHITHWNFASQDWHCPLATNSLREGEHFIWRMEAKDGSMGFDFSGTYTRVEKHKLIEYELDDGRKVSVSFSERDGATHITEHFEAENMNSRELQQKGWQAILDHLKSYAESLS